ncbi:hypothetical protein HYU07_07355 [Candidatus Woesearchaeota archaeon]|nr:hypothetical protein [Candidatus Woesearchaeota archaeon]
MVLDTKLKPIRIESWNDLVPSLRLRLAKLGYEGTHVIIRHYDGDRTKRVQTWGTDRDKDSQVWDYPEDACHRGSPESVNAANITYARTLDLSRDPVRPIPLYRQPIDSIDNLDYLAKLEDTKGMAVYTPKGLRRVTENEYHFIGNQRDVLIAIFLVNGKQSSE